MYDFFEELALQLAAVSPDYFDTFMLDAEAEIGLLAGNDRVEVIQLACYIFLLH